jgi:hypothetical protein
MRTIIAALAIAGIILGSIVGAFTGAGIMIYDIYSDGPNFMKGFELFSLSSILLLVTVSAYMLTKVLTASEVMANIMGKYLQNEMVKEIEKNIANPQTNPLAAFFGMGNFPGQGTIKMATMDEHGNIVPLGERTFSSPEELIKHRNDILNNAFGNAPKKLEDMTIEELKAEEKKAVENQEFELAACIVNLIQERAKA